MTPRPGAKANPTDPKTWDTAWRIHAVQMDWTNSVDAKASFAFAIESAAIATAVGLSTSDRLFSALPGFTPLLYWSGLVLLMVGAGFAAAVVTPRLRGRLSQAESSTNFIYFGHVRNWNASELESALRANDLLPQLARQITVMASIAWKKHLRVQWSLWSATLGGLSLIVCGLISSFWSAN